MKNLIKILVASLLILALIPRVHGQRNVSDEKVLQARLLLNDYRDASLFRDMNNGYYDPSWESIFRNCFTADARIVFDIPFRIKQLDENAESQKIKIYNELVTIDDYIETIKSAYNFYFINDFGYSFTEIGMDISNLETTNKLQFEIRKSFDITNWSTGDAGSYIVEMQFIENQPRITAIRLVDENISRSRVSLTFINSTLDESDPGYRLAGMVSYIRLVYDQAISNRNLISKTDGNGHIDLGLIPNHALLKIDTVIDPDGNKYSIPSEWKKVGKKVNAQEGSFRIPVQPWKWNGFSWSVKGFGGIIGQAENQLTNFSPESKFENEPGYQFGFGIEILKLLNLDEFLDGFGNWFTTTNPNKLKKRRNYFLGAGLGISYYQYQYKIISESFTQNAYTYIDRLGTPAEVVVSGTDYTDITSSNGLMIPLFLEIRKIFPDKTRTLQAFSFQTGVNLTVPFETSYEITGNFSRHGIYNQFNPQPITDDPFYNYYTDVNKAVDEISQNNTISPALMFRINGFFNVSGNKSDNLLDIGLLVSFPFKGSSPSGSGNYYIATGNDDFSSMSNSKNRIYNYFVGVSVGYNFINYRLY